MRFAWGVTAYQSTPKNQSADLVAPTRQGLVEGEA